MAKQTITISGAQSSITFGNGTVLEVRSAGGAATQFTNEGKGLRSAQFPAEIDTSPQFDRALEENGIYEQETIHVDVATPGSMLRAAAGMGADQAILRPAPPPSQAEQVVLYQDESGGLSWHFRQPAAAEQVVPARRRGGLRAPFID